MKKLNHNAITRVSYRVLKGTLSPIYNVHSDERASLPGSSSMIKILKYAFSHEKTAKDCEKLVILGTLKTSFDTH